MTSDRSTDLSVAASANKHNGDRVRQEINYIIGDGQQTKWPFGDSVHKRCGL